MKQHAAQINRSTYGKFHRLQQDYHLSCMQHVALCIITLNLNDVMKGHCTWHAYKALDLCNVTTVLP